MAINFPPAYTYRFEDKEEFCKVHSIHEILLINGFYQSIHSSKHIHMNQEIYSEYNNTQWGLKILIDFLLQNGGKIFFIKIYNSDATLIKNLHNSYDCYIHFNCSGNVNKAANWNTDTTLKPQQIQNNFQQLQQYQNFYPVPTFDLYDYFNKSLVNYSLNLQSLIPRYLIERMAHYFAEETNMPESTLILVGLGIFSGFTCRKWNCAYPNGETAPICLYVAAEQDTSNGKSRVVDAFQKPFIDIIEKEIEKIEAIILIKQKELNELLETEIDLEKEDKQRFKIKTKALKEELEKLKEKIIKANHIIPKTNTTPQALEESLNHTNGFFIAAADEQSLIDTLISGKGKQSNEILLKGRNAERIQSLRISRDGYSGKVTGSFICFAQTGSIDKIIKASGESGLRERFLMISEPEIMNKDHLKEIPYPSELFTEYAKKFDCFKILIEKLLIKELSNNNKLITLKIFDKGWRAINEFNNELEGLILPNENFSYKMLKGMAKKSNSQIMSIASNLHLLESVELPLLEGDHYIEDRFVYAAIEIMRALLYSTRDYLERNSIIGNKDELRSIIDYFIGTDGKYKKIKVNIHSLEGRKNLGSGKRKMIQDTLNFLFDTHNLIQYTDGTVGLNPMIQL
jgi:hypothetical protein